VVHRRYRFMRLYESMIDRWSMVTVFMDEESLSPGPLQFPVFERCLY
jgi:hypothetical protein